MEKESCGCKPETPRPQPGSCPPPAAETKTACCPPAPPADSGCCPEQPTDDRPGYRIQPFVRGWIRTQAGSVPRASTSLTAQDRFGRWQMRWGLGRQRYSIAPGIYAVGQPKGSSPVLVTANYKMTFDLLRRDLEGLDAWVLVLDTKGINVWCAAGKGTFGTEEIIRRVKASHLDQVVDHRTLILPQLGAPGVAAHKVRAGCGFRVVYGPVRSADIRAFIQAGMQASPNMRKVTFGMVERLVLTPVELVNMGKPMLYATAALLVLGGLGPGVFSLTSALERGTATIAAMVLAVVAGAVATPVLLPWLPGRHFALKGAVCGLAAALAALPATDSLLSAVALLLGVTTLSSWCAMNFTGSTTFTSPSGVEKEMRLAMPLQAVAATIAILSWIAGAF